MKKQWLLALWLVCWAVFPINTFAYENWIYEININWTDVKTVIYGDTKFTIKMADQPWPQYFWWFNEPGSNSVFDDTNNPWQWTYMDENDGKMHGGTYWVNNIWWWSWDNATNWFDNWNEKYTRRWPCDTWYHVPSRWEWNALLTAWCNIDENCHARYSDTQIGWITWDLIKATDWSDENKLIYITKWTTGFRTTFHMTWGVGYRSSSPYSGNDTLAYRLYTNTVNIDPGNFVSRDSISYRVRCLKDEVEYPESKNPSEPGITITHYPNKTVSYTLNGNQNFTGWIFTITDWTTKITMLDTNLWASVAGIWVQSIWYHFQWWNNYWFDPFDINVDMNAVSVSGGWAQRKGSYVNSWYYWEVFITSDDEYWNDYWEIKPWATLQNYYQLRWWNVINDGTYFEPLKKNQARVRQGPCPEWFHVPSIWEWNKLINMMTWTDAEKVSILHNGLLIPFAGIRDSGNASVSSEENALRSSSPYWYDHASRAIGMSTSGELYMGEGYRAWGASIRCFYNEYDSYIEPQTITNIDISNIPEPTIWGHWVTWVLDITPTPANSIEILDNGYEPNWFVKRVGGQQDCALWGLYCDEVFSWEDSQIVSYYLRILYNPARWYKVWDSLTVTTDSTRHNQITAKYEPSDGFYSIKITYLPSELPIGIERINLSWNIIPLVHWTTPTKDITTDTTWVTLWNIVWWKWDSCTPLADGETIDASNSKYCLSIDITTASWYETTFDYEIFLNNSHRIGYYDGDGAYACTSSLIKNQKIVPSYKIEFISSWEVIDTRYREHWCTLKDCVLYGDSLRIPSRSWYTFTGWYSDSGFNNEWDWDNDQIVSNVSLYAKWIENPSSGWQSWWNASNQTSNQTAGGFSWRGRHTTTDVSENEHESADDNTENTTEFEQAYKFAYENWITTMDTIEKADMEWPLTRIAMAKMLSNYAINIQGKKPANIIIPNFKDITPELNDEYDFWVSLAYQLGIMWINMPDNKFRPFDFVTRAEFATALSRMLFSTPDGDPYYVTHIEKLKEEWIIKDDNPDMQELRWYVMIMLMRSTKN